MGSHSRRLARRDGGFSEVRRVRFDEARVLVGGIEALYPLLPKLDEHGFYIVLCCGELPADRLIGAYHPERIKPEEVVTCPKCSKVFNLKAHSMEEARHQPIKDEKGD